MHYRKRYCKNLLCREYTRTTCITFLHTARMYSRYVGVSNFIWRTRSKMNYDFDQITLLGN